MIKLTSKNELRKIRHARIRKKVSGTSTHPRLSIYFSQKNVYAQLIDDEHSTTLVAASTLEKELKEELKDKNFTEKAEIIGKLIGERALSKGISAIVFDRSGYSYHGRLKALADAARKAGLQF